MVVGISPQHFFSPCSLAFLQLYRLEVCSPRVLLFAVLEFAVLRSVVLAPTDQDFTTPWAYDSSPGTPARSSICCMWPLCSRMQPPCSRIQSPCSRIQPLAYAGFVGGGAHTPCRNQCAQNGAIPGEAQQYEVMLALF